MKEQVKLVELSKVSIDALVDQIGVTKTRGILKAHGFDADTLEELGFSQSYLCGLGFEIE